MKILESNINKHMKPKKKKKKKKKKRKNEVENISKKIAVNEMKESFSLLRVSRRRSNL